MDRKKENLKLLGHEAAIANTYTPEVLETFENQNQENDYWVRFNCPEFTALSPGSPTLPRYASVTSPTAGW